MNIDYPNLKNIMAYPESYREVFAEKVRTNNLHYRIQLFDKLNPDDPDDPDQVNDPVLLKQQKAFMDHFAENPIDFINLCCTTNDPRNEINPHLPFVTYPYQDEFILWLRDRAENWEDWWMEKSRDVWFSRMIVVLLMIQEMK